MSARRSPEQVHEQDGHPTPVASCSLCHPAPAAETAAVPMIVGEPGPESVRLATGGVISAGSVIVLGRDGPEAFIRHDRPPGNRGECVEDGCTNQGTHRDGRCCACHGQPRQGD